MQIQTDTLTYTYHRSIKDTFALTHSIETERVPLKPWFHVKIKLF